MMFQKFQHMLQVLTSVKLHDNYKQTSHHSLTSMLQVMFSTSNH